MEQAAWEAESVLVSIQMKMDTDEQHWKKEEEKSKAEQASLDALEAAARDVLARYRVERVPVEVTLDDAIKQRIAADRLAVLAEYRQESTKLLQQLKVITRPRATDDLIPWFMIVALVGLAGAIGWMIPPDDHTKMIAAGSAAGGALVVGVVCWIFYRTRRRARVVANAKALYASLVEALAFASDAARVDSVAAALARERVVKDARRKRDQEVLVARDKAKLQQTLAAEQHHTALAEQTKRYTDQLSKIEEQRRRGLEELQQHREKTTHEIEQKDSTTRHDAETHHTQTTAAIESKYEQECQSLAARWDEGLRRVTDLLAAGSSIDPNLIDWNNSAWDHWKPRRILRPDPLRRNESGSHPVNRAIAQTHCKLPGTFTRARNDDPSRPRLLVRRERITLGAATPPIDLAQLVMARLLTQIPAGRVKFTIYDPVGLGQSFAGFMHLADHDESLVGSRIWTEKEHMQQRLADLTEHMETVIQKYLRNEYATIDQYNARAGELAEPYRYLVIADFPTGFEQESLRRLSSIAISGPRCGVYTIILRDTRQALPPGSRIEDFTSRSVHLLCKNSEFTWNDAVFKRFPLRIDPAPDEKTLTRLMDLVGKAAKEAKRVEVPFQSIAPADSQFWSMSSKNELRVPIGKSGATRLQSLRLGVGVAQHVLVAGKTGSGKSNLMHTIVTNMAMWYGPDEVEFYLVDFKKGVEFKAYVTSQLPHARAIAVESDREFGISVLQRVDAELTRRGTMFRDAGAQEISAFRDKTGQKLPRTILLIDEFQEFFSEDDKVGQDASGLLDRLVRQGRAFGVHVVLGSQTIGGSSGLGRSTFGQIAVRVALQTSEADSQMILGDNNSAARLLTRPGEAIYNDAGGLVEANSPFQIAFLPDDQRDHYLDHVRRLAESQGVSPPTQIVFEGNSAAGIATNHRLAALLESPTFPPPASTIPAYIGEPVAIKEPSAIPMRRQSGVNVLMVGQQEESAVAIFASMIASLAAQYQPADALFYIMDGTPADSRYFGLLERVMATIPHPTKLNSHRQVPDAVNELSTLLAERQGSDAHAGPSVFLFLFGLQRYRLLRRQEDDFSFSRGEEAAAPKTDKQFVELLAEGPGLGIHTIIWADTPITLERTLERASMRQFDHRILFQMSASDSSNLIDSPLANRLGLHRALHFSEEQGTLEKFRPYELPNDARLHFLTEHLKNRAQPQQTH